MPKPELRRCPTGSEGRYKVSLRVANSKEEIAVQIGAHTPVYRYRPDGSATVDGDGIALIEDQAPVVTTRHDFEGELCEHELAFLEGVPGKDYRPEYEFEIEKLD